MRNYELRGCLFIVLGITLLAELFSLSGIITSPHAELGRVLFSENNLFLIGGITLHTFLMKVFAPVSRKELAIMLVTGCIFTLIYTGFNDVSELPWWYLLSIPQAGLGLSALGLIIHGAYYGQAGHKNLNRNLLIGSVCVYLVALNVDCYLQLTSAIHPVVYDLSAYRFDLSLGANFSAYTAALFELLPFLKTAASSAYFVLPYGFSVLYGLYLARPERVPANILYIIFFSMFCAFVFYHIAPVSGPLYTFGNYFPHNMPAAEEIQRGFSVISPAPRNAVPSMHFGWALIMWIIALNYNFLIRLLFGLLLVLNVAATIGLGEHYLVDLFIAVPLVLFAFSFCSGTRQNNRGVRFYGLLTGFFLTIAWCLYIRYGYGTFNSLPGMSWVLVLGTVFICYRLLLSSGVLNAGRIEGGQEQGEKASSGFKPSFSTALVCLVFFCSGFAALVYQVLFSKILSYTFGSNSSAVYTVLATYMGGMAIGAWLGGKLALIKRPPLKIYALVEIIIAVYCLLSPSIFNLTQNIYILIGQGMLPGQPGLEILRFMLGVFVLLVPTILMGITLPVLVEHFRFRKKTYGNSIAILYSFNTSGAALGALVSGYFIIPAIGVSNTIYLAAWINFLAAGIAYIYSNKRAYIPAEDKRENEPQPVTSSHDLNFLKSWSGFIAVTIIGFISLGMEVVYVHMLSIVAGNSVYAFSLMLFTFLIGLGSGSELARQLMLKKITTASFISFLSAMLFLTILGGVFLWEQIPDYFASFVYYPLARTFSEREFIRGLVCFISMFPPAFIIGCLYPACLQHVADVARGIRIRTISSAIALNTVGNILGVIITGFIALPWMGTLDTIKLLAILSAFVCIYFLMFSSSRQRIVIGFPALAGLIVFNMIPEDFNYTRLASGSNVYFKEQNYGEVIDHLESLDGGLTTVHDFSVSDEKIFKVLLTNGKFQGTDDIQGEMIPQLSIGLVPLQHTESRNQALVIGYGTGATARILHEAGFNRLDVVDISNDIFLMADKYFLPVNNGVTTKENVNKVVTDGRNYLLLSDRQYDLVSIQISSIWFAGAASLYNHEFYQLVNRNLTADGVLQQWVQLHHTTPYDLVYIIGTLRSVFEYVRLYVVGGQGILVASNTPKSDPSNETIRTLQEIPYVEYLARNGIDAFSHLQNTLLMGPEAVDRLVKSFIAEHGRLPVSDNDNSILEYSTPKSNVLDSSASYSQNIEWLAGFRRQ